jgi:hypothetical protein
MSAQDDLAARIDRAIKAARTEDAAPAAPAKRRRRLTLSAILRQAKAAGVGLAGATVQTDGTIKVEFATGAESQKPDDEVEAWFRKHAH